MNTKKAKYGLNSVSLMLSLTLTGMELKNPLILAAGVMGTTGGSLKRIADNGAGAVVTKSLGIEPSGGHSNPSMVEVDCGYLNAMGLPNPSYKNFQQEIDIPRAQVPVIASIFGGCALDFSEIAGILDVDAFELNVSCPHAHGYGAYIGTDPDLVEDITKAVKAATDAPVWVKLTPNVTDITRIGLAAQRGGADAVVAINTVRGMAIDIDSGYPVLGNRFGGLSGRAIKPVAIKCVYDLYDALKIPVIGVGGISDWKDAIEFIMAGARGIEVGSAVGNNINVFKDISLGMEAFLVEKEWTLDDIYGMAHKL